MDNEQIIAMDKMKEEKDKALDNLSDEAIKLLEGKIPTTTIFKICALIQKAYYKGGATFISTIMSSLVDRIPEKQQADAFRKLSGIDECN